MTEVLNTSRRAFLRGRLVAPPASEQSAHIAQIGAACMAFHNVVCRSCGDACEAQAIRFRPRMGAAALPEIDSERCTGCNDCRGVCPSQAISLIPFNEEAP